MMTRREFDCRVSWWHRLRGRLCEAEQFLIRWWWWGLSLKKFFFMVHFQVARSPPQHLLCEAEHARGVKAGGGELPDHWKLLLPPYRNCPTGGEKIHTDNSFQTQKMLKKIAGQFFFYVVHVHLCDLQTSATFSGSDRKTWSGSGSANRLTSHTSLDVLRVTEADLTASFNWRLSPAFHDFGQRLIISRLTSPAPSDSW